MEYFYCSQDLFVSFSLEHLLVLLSYLLIAVFVYFLANTLLDERIKYHHGELSGGGMHI